MTEYIDREAAIRALAQFKRGFRHGEERCTIDGCVLEIKTVPAADVAPVRRGKWILHSNGSGTCDQCHFTQCSVWDFDNWQNFCGHCGADMRGE